MPNSSGNYSNTTNVKVKLANADNSKGYFEDSNTTNVKVKQ